MKKFNNKGFTLIELLVVVAIIGILASVGVVAYNGYTESAKKGAAGSNHNSVKKWVQNELQKCSIGEDKAMPNAAGAGQLDCAASDDADATKIATAVGNSIGKSDDFPNPYGGGNAIQTTGKPSAGACAKANRGFTYVTNVSDAVSVFTCKAAAVGDVTNEESSTVQTN